MIKNTSLLFDTYTSLDRKIVRKEIEFPPIAEYRKSLIGIFQQLDRTDNRQDDVAQRIWSIISKLQTSTASFDKMLLDATRNIFISKETIKENWGYEIWANYQRANSIVDSLLGSANPILDCLIKCVTSLMAGESSFAIYCPKEEVLEIKQSFGEAGIDISQINFLSTVADYRKSSLFDIIIKIGPMRRQGRARTADALLTSPKCKTIIQLIWEKSPDESAHGYDPIVPVVRDEGGFIKSKIVNWVVETELVVVEWSKVIPPPTIEALGISLSDDLTLLSGESREFRSAVLLSLYDGYGILFAPATKLVVFNLNQEETGASDVCSAATIKPGSFIAIVGAYTVDLDENSLVGSDRFSIIWKQKLVEADKSNSSEFYHKLQKNGLDLWGLRSAIKHWMQPTSTVIHAPQKKAHFKILCCVLGLTTQVNYQNNNIPFWRAAWDEISISRGEAILEGMHNADIIESKVLQALRNFNADIQSEIGDSNKYLLKVPFDGVGGYFPVTLHKVLEVESGYRAPDAEFRKILQLEFIQLWQ